MEKDTVFFHRANWRIFRVLLWTQLLLLKFLIVTIQIAQCLD
ncbi:MAG: hypothetical protein AB7F86_16860 [Bdellovibrionales bacterium]